MVLGCCGLVHCVGFVVGLCCLFLVAILYGLNDAIAWVFDCVGLM